MSFNNYDSTFLGFCLVDTGQQLISITLRRMYMYLEVLNSYKVSINSGAWESTSPGMCTFHTAYTCNAEVLNS